MGVVGNTSGLKSGVTSRLEKASQKLGTDIYVLHGKEKRKKRSAHTYGIAADVSAHPAGTVEITNALVSAGFTGVGEYYDSNGGDRRFAHGDIRGLPGSEGCGVYAPGESHGRPACWTGTGKPPEYTKGRRSGSPCPQ